MSLNQRSSKNSRSTRQNPQLKPVFFIIGPTAAGKTKLAIMLATKVNGEIISADSMQAYKKMEILSQMPTLSERRFVKHHLVNYISPEKEYSAAKFAKEAERSIKKIIKKSKIPIVVGGSGLYVKALIDGIFPSRGKSPRIRKKYEKLAIDKGKRHVYDILKTKDPISARSIHPNDLKRTIRALEIYGLDKKTKTVLKKNTKGIKKKYKILIFGIALDRKKLYEKINRRVDLMFRKGLVKEVKKLIQKNLSITSKQALGIKEIKGYLKGDYNTREAKELLKRKTRRFAKRQLTWFRPDKNIIWLDMDELGKDGIIRRIKKSIF